MIPIARPLVGDAEADAAAAVIRGGWLSQGTVVAEFESRFAKTVSAPFACAVSNCTTALHLALLAAGVGPGDEVVTVSHSFIATANAIRYCGAEPILVDIEADGFNIDPNAVADAIGPRTRAMLCVHQMGMPCDLLRLSAVAAAHGLPLIEDAACAIGSEVQLDRAFERIGGPHGDVACFSFHPRKVVTTGEGGMLTTRHEAWDAKFRLWRQHGMSLPADVRHRAREIVHESYELVGFNYRMTDVQAAIGLSQLDRLPGIVAERRRLAKRYDGLLAGLVDVRTPREPDWARSNWQSYCIGLGVEVDQRQVMQALLERGIATRRGIMCAHREPPYRGAGRHGALARSEAAQDRSILLPLFPGLSGDDQDRIANELGRACAAARTRRERVSGP